MNLEWWQYLLLALAGAAAGFIDAIAGGGGLISVPALLWAGLPPQVALGTNKLQSTSGTLLAVAHYTRAGLIGWRSLRLTLVITFVAAAGGAWAVAVMDPALLRRTVPSLLITVAIYTLLNRKLGERSRAARIGMTAFALIFGALLGFYDGFFGPGVGSFWMFACVLTLGQDLRAATGTTKALNLASNLAALITFALGKCLRFDAGLAMIIGQLAGARLGSGLVIAHGTRIIRPLFIAVALALALRLAWQAFFG
ncbi:MAG: TSUP family transporter [Chthoniobacteraceae bacterium]